MALTNTAKTANLSGQSMIGDNSVAYLSANVQSGGSISINMTIGDLELYSKNKAVVDTDFKAFKEDVILTAQGGINSEK